MKTLLILRHGQAAPEGTGTDWDRPLTEHGKREVDHVGQALRDSDKAPGCVISSSALRARDSARRVAKVGKWKGPISELDELYLAEPEAYIMALNRLAGPFECALLVGHNPGLEALALILTGSPVSLATAGLVVCTLEIASFEDLTLALHGKITDLSHRKEREP